MRAGNEGKPGGVRRVEQVWELRPAVARLLRYICAELPGRHLPVRAERWEEADDIRHRGEDADQLTLTVLLESPGCGEADSSDTGHDAERLCQGTEARWQMNESCFVHELLQIKDEQGPPDEPDNVIAKVMERRSGARRARVMPSRTVRRACGAVRMPVPGSSRGGGGCLRRSGGRDRPRWPARAALPHYRAECGPVTA